MAPRDVSPETRTDLLGAALMALRSKRHFNSLLASNRKLKRPHLGVRGGGFSLQNFLTSASACSREL